MGQPYIGEIRITAFSFAPSGWAFCNGQLIPISENDALYTLIGTRYGGDGQENFALPNLQSRTALHMGRGPGITGDYVMGEAAGVESVTLNAQQIPVHNHALVATTSGGQSPNPKDQLLASPPAVSPYTRDTPSQALTGQPVGPVGGSQPHDNMMPYLTLSYVISLFGVFPTQS